MEMILLRYFYESAMAESFSKTASKASSYVRRLDQEMTPTAAWFAVAKELIRRFGSVLSFFVGGKYLRNVLITSCKKWKL